MTENQQKFFERLNRLGTGERAALRREAGNMLQNADGTALTVFYRCLPPAVDNWQEGKWFAVACLRCLWDAGETAGEPLEQVIAALLRSGDFPGFPLRRGMRPPLPGFLLQSGDFPGFPLRIGVRSLLPR